eukprot:4592764-Amphidinium_carterae.1
MEERVSASTTQTEVFQRRNKTDKLTKAHTMRLQLEKRSQAVPKRSNTHGNAPTRNERCRSQKKAERLPTSH